MPEMSLLGGTARRTWPSGSYGGLTRDCSRRGALALPAARTRSWAPAMARCDPRGHCQSGGGFGATAWAF